MKLLSSSVAFRSFSLRRWKSTASRRKLKPKTTSTDRALKYFDDFYQPVFTNRWPSIRLGLLCPHKYCAVVNNFSDIEATCDLLKEKGAMDVGELYNSNLKKRLVKTGKSEESDLNEETTTTEKIKDVVVVEEEDDDEEENDEEMSPPPDDLSHFVPAKKLKGLENYLDESDFVGHYKSDVEVPFEKKTLPESMFPKNLRVFIFDRTNLSSFPSPKRDSTGLFTYYLMDAASLLPALLLNVSFNDVVLDLCAAPGGKSLTIIQSMDYKSIVCNDFKRNVRLNTVLNSYLSSRENLNVKVTKDDATSWNERDVYDKILVDVPCTNDRKSVNDNENNIFNPMRIKERILLPEMQIKMLHSALVAVKVGGTVVYSTCSLSPIQNDGVVHMALNKLWQETNAQFVINDLNRFVIPWTFLFRFHKEMRYGQLVLPYLPLNYGPMYFCSITKIK